MYQTSSHLYPSSTYIHIFKVPSGENTLEKPQENFFTDAQPCDGDDDQDMSSQPCKDLTPDEDLDTPSDDNEDDSSDTIKNFETEGGKLDDVTLCDGSKETQLDPDPHDVTQRVLPPHERMQSEADVWEREPPKLDGQLCQAPTQLQAAKALQDLRAIIDLPRKTGAGHKDPKLDPFVRTWIEGMQTMLNFYTNPWLTTYGKWGASACQAAISLDRGQYCARQLARLSKQFILDGAVLPVNPNGNWNETMLVDEDLVSNINLYLQELGKEISAKRIVQFLACPDIKEKHGITKNISEQTACRYLKILDYRFMAAKKGQYADGHEQADVVWY
jgi:hypothetical protein